MKIMCESFGEMDNQQVTSYTFVNDNGMEVSCINYGCIITKVMVPDRNGNYENIVLGFHNINDYIDHSPYFGSVIGRVAGRIKGGSFDLNGTTYTLEQNENSNHLHGGNRGFHNVVWTAATIHTDEEIGVEFSYTSVDQEEGYPGNLQIKVIYTLDNYNTLRIRYYGKSDQDTLLNLTNHTYFNLSGNAKRDISTHSLQLKSCRFLELNEELLPTGEIVGVEGTPFDFQKEKSIGEGIALAHPQIELAGGGYDHPFLLDAQHDEEIVLSDIESGRMLVIETDEPSVVLYTGNQLKDDFETYGVRSRKYLGLCLETQGLPDAIHHPHFPSIILSKEEEYSSLTTYTFKVRK